MVLNSASAQKVEGSYLEEGVPVDVVNDLLNGEVQHVLVAHDLGLDRLVLCCRPVHLHALGLGIGQVDVPAVAI